MASVGPVPARSRGRRHSSSRPGRWPAPAVGSPVSAVHQPVHCLVHRAVAGVHDDQAESVARGAGGQFGGVAPAGGVRDPQLHLAGQGVRQQIATPGGGGGRVRVDDQQGAHVRSERYRRHPPRRAAALEASGLSLDPLVSAPSIRRRSASRRRRRCECAASWRWRRRWACWWWRSRSSRPRGRRPEVGVGHRILLPGLAAAHGRGRPRAAAGPAVGPDPGDRAGADLRTGRVLPGRARAGSCCRGWRPWWSG